MNKKLPFEESWISEKESVRLFQKDLYDEELKWHIDLEDRIIESIGDNDWEFQFDNKLPIKIEGPIHIRKGQWHRLIKGTTDLKLRITRV